MKLTRNLLVASVVALMGVMALPALASAQDAPPAVDYRKSIMQGFRLHMGAIRAVMSGAAPAGHVEHHAVAFNRLAITLGNAFPEGSMHESSRALPAIWDNRSEFMDKVSAIQSATAELIEAGQSGDSEAVSAAMSNVQSTCGSCHQPFRGPAR